MLNSLHLQHQHQEGYNMATRLDLLNKLSAQAPDLANQAVVKGQASRDALLQQQLGAAPTNANTQQLQQLQAQQVGMAGQAAVENLGQQQQAAAGLGQQVLQEKAQQSEVSQARAALGQEESQASSQNSLVSKLQGESLESRKKQTQADIASAKKLQSLGFTVDSNLQMATYKQRQDLARLGNGIKEELLDSRLAFESDEAGRKFSNTRQLADYAISSAKSDIEAKDKMQSILNAAKTQELMMGALRDRLATIQQQGFVERQGDLDAQSAIKVANLRADAEKRAQKAKSDAANRQSMWSSAGSLIGVGAAIALAPATGGVSLAAVGAGAAGGGAAGSLLNNYLS